MGGLWRCRVYLAALLVCGACGPTRYVTIVHHQAQRALDEAAAVQAETLAPYEFTIAQADLRRARELAGYSRWSDAIELGKKATTYAEKARAIAVEQAQKPKEIKE
jgi:hypothetical protein